MNPHNVEQIITGIKQLSEVALAVVGLAFTVYNTVVSNYNRRALIEHRRAIDQLQLNTPPPPGGAP